MLEVTPLLEALGQGVADPLSYIQTTSGSNYAAGYSSLLDYFQGDNRPLWINELQHAAHRGDARNVATAVTLTHNIADNLENYVIGSGFNYTAKAKLAGTDGNLVQQVQRDIDRILADNGWHADNGSEEGSAGLENQLHNRSRVDGEDFLALFSPRRGDIEMRLINAEHIAQPYGYERRLEDEIGFGNPQTWRYGVHTFEKDIQKPLGYCVQWNIEATEFDYFPATNWELAARMRTGLMHHIKRNVNVKVKRGLSDFFPVVKQLVDDAKLMRNIVTGAQVQAAIAWIEQYASQHANLQGAGREIEASADKSRSVASASGGSHTEYRQHVGPGTVLRISKGKEFMPGPMGSERNNGFIAVAGESVKRIGVRWNMPEYMISADASNGNYASTLVAEGPFVKSRQKDQSFYAGHFKAILWKALTILVSQRLYAKYAVYSIKDLKNRIELYVDCPEVASRDQLKDAQAKQILNQNGVLSAQTWQATAGLEPSQESENFRVSPPISQDASEQRIAEESVNRIATRVQQTLFDGWEREAKSYP